VPSLQGYAAPVFQPLFLYARTLVFMIVLWAEGLLLYHLRDYKSNDYCTAYSYGWPYPWRIDNCECDG
jgi:hypothetical protein